MLVALNYEEIEQVLNESLSLLEDIAVEQMQSHIKKKKLTLTDELFNSVRSEIIAFAGEMVGRVRLHFRVYGRFKDMKHIEYRSFQKPNTTGKKIDRNNPYSEDDYPDIVKGMMAFINRVGLDDFRQGVPGYEGKAWPEASRAVARMAWTLTIHRLKRGIIRRKGEGWYNVAIAQVLRKAKPQVAEKVANVLAKQTAKGISRVGS